MRGPQTGSRIARDVSIVAFLLGVLLFLAAEAASAAITSGQETCPVAQNWAKINGVTYTAANDTEANPVLLPAGEEIQVEYNGKVTKKITDHSGHIAIEIGGAGFVVGDWANPNKPRSKMKAHGFKTFTVPNVPGIYDITGSHNGNGGGCGGFAVARVTGDVLTTPAGAGAVGGTAAAGGGLLAAAFARPRKGVV